MERFKFTERGGSYSVKIYSDGGTITAPVEIPSEYENKPVTELTFGEKTDANFQRLTIPNTVKEIVFDHLPSDNKNIFADELAVGADNPSYRTDGKALYSKDGKILYRLLPRYIEEYEVLRGTETIAANAFEGLENLASVSLPEGLREIEGQAFGGCKALGELHIPSTVEKVAWELLSGGQNVYIVSPDNPFFRSENGIVYNKDMTVLLRTPIAMPETFTVPQSVKLIGNRALLDCRGLSEVILPNRCTVSKLAFGWCCDLKKINLENVAEINDGAFSGCASLLEAELHCDKIPSGAFSLCRNLREVRLDCVEIAKEAFSGCHSLTAITFSDRIKTIGTRAFDDCYALRKVNLPEGLTSIEPFAFFESPLTDVTVPKTATYIGKLTFCKAKKVTVYDTVKIWDNFFSGADVSFSPDRELTVRCAATDNELYRIWAGYKTEDMKRFTQIMLKCFTENGFDFDLADSTFDELSDSLTKAYYAYYRLTNPHPPSPGYARKFTEHLRTEGLTIAMNCIIEKRSSLIMRLADYILTLRNITPISELTNKQGMTELTAFLLDYRNKHFGAPLDNLKLE